MLPLCHNYLVNILVTLTVGDNGHADWTTPTHLQIKITLVGQDAYIGVLFYSCFGKRGYTLYIIIYTDTL